MLTMTVLHDDSDRDKIRKFMEKLYIYDITGPMFTYVINISPRDEIDEMVDVSYVDYCIERSSIVIAPFFIAMGIFTASDAPVSYYYSDNKDMSPEHFREFCKTLKHKSSPAYQFDENGRLILSFRGI